MQRPAIGDLIPYDRIHRELPWLAAVLDRGCCGLGRGADGRALAVWERLEALRVRSCRDRDGGVRRFVRMSV